MKHLWDQLDSVRKRQNVPRNAQELAAALTEEWNNLPVRQINNLVHPEHQGSDRRPCWTYPILTVMTCCEINGTCFGGTEVDGCKWKLSE